MVYTGVKPAIYMYYQVKRTFYEPFFIDGKQVNLKLLKVKNWLLFVQRLQQNHRKRNIVVEIVSFLHLTRFHL